MGIVLKVRGAVGASVMREFYCEPCDAWFTTYTRMQADGEIEQRTHDCGALCSTRIRPGSRIAFRSSEVVPPDRRKNFQHYWGLNDKQMLEVTNEQIDKVYKKHGLVEVDASWDENSEHRRRSREGQLAKLPPQTEDPNVVRDYNAKRYGHAYVQEQQEKTRTAFEAMQRGDEPPHLPEATSVDVHATPHLIDPEKTIAEISKARTVDPERRRELQGKLVTG